MKSVACNSTAKGKRAPRYRVLWFALVALVSLSANARKAEVEKPIGAPVSIVSGIVRPPDADEVKALEQARKSDLEIFLQRTRDFDGAVNSTIAHMYGMRRKFVEDAYTAKLRAEEALEVQALRDAIAYFEAFLKKYSDSSPQTPDAMFRLAELYYDIAYIDFIEALDAYSDASDKNAAVDIEMPEKDFSRSIALFEGLVKRYPEYQHIDGAYYLLGYCLNEMGRLEEARLAWLNLVCANHYTYDPVAYSASVAAKKTGPLNPSASLDTGIAASEQRAFTDPFADCTAVSGNSRFFFESWWLIGNYHFDFDTSKYGVETAMSAYEKLVTDPKHKFYDKGLYKLAWSYFKADRYPEAVHSFSRVVDYSDQNGKKDWGMRPEAIQYLAVCFFTDDWNVDTFPDEDAGLPRLQDPKFMPQDRPWTREVYTRLGDIYSENEKHDEAIAVWNLYLKKWPLDVDAPFIQDRVANSYREMRRFEEELAARSKLDSYGKGSAWWLANEDHPEAQSKVATMAQDALINSAVSHHQNAQAFRSRAQASGDKEIMGFALDEYNLAAAAYRKYIEQNPDSPNAYDLNYQLADALFWSGQYEQARVEYVAVRDSNLDVKYRADSAAKVIYCIENMIATEVAEGRLVIREQPPALKGTPPVPEPLPIPILLAELMTEREAFLARDPASPNASAFEYQSAQNYYRYGHWDEARQRYEQIYERYCQKDEIAIISWKTLLNMASDQNDLDAKEKLALMEQQKQCGAGIASAEGDGAIDLGSLLGDVAMQRATSRFKECAEAKEEKICSDAGDQLVAAVAKAPTHPSADGALHNAALAYENAKRFETAMQIYGRIVNEYPQSRWVDKCLFKQGFAANAFFEYETALSSYRILADEKRFAESEYRQDAIINTALILTNLQSYVEAVPYWKRYAAEVSEPEKVIEASFNAADMYYRAKSYNDAIKAYESFISSFGRNPGAGPFIVKASFRIGLCHHARNKTKQEQEARERTVGFYNKLVNEPGSISAEYAAESHFLIVEEDMRQFEKFAISGSMKVVNEKMKEGAQKVKAFEERYRQVQKYRRPEWSLAAEFRIGYAYEVYAKAILAIPPPPLDPEMQKDLKRLPKEDRDMIMADYEDKFRAGMETFVTGAEERAQVQYRSAVNLAREGNISNDWTLLALERMNAYNPEEFPRQHNGIVIIESNTLLVPPWAGEVSQ